MHPSRVGYSSFGWKDDGPVLGDDHSNQTPFSIVRPQWTGGFQRRNGQSRHAADGEELRQISAVLATNGKAPVWPPLAR